MGGDSIDQLERYQLKRLRVARQAGVVMSIVMMAYVCLAEFNVVPRSPHYETITAFGLASALGIAAVCQLLGRNWSALSQGVLLGLVHLLSATLIVLSVGFLSPLTVLWLLLTTVSDMFLSRYTASLSIIGLYATMLLSLYMENSFTHEVFLLHLAYATAIAVLGWFIRELRSVQVAEHDELVRTRKREISQQNQLMTLINSMSQAVISVTPAGNIQLYNAATLDLLDTNQNLSGRSIDDVFHLVDEKGEPVSIMTELEKNSHSIQREDLSFQVEDGDLIHLDINSSVIYGSDNQLSGRIIIMRDITKAKTLDEERDEFISIVSHELRTPITIAEGTISNLGLLIDKNAAPEVVNKSISSAHDQVVYLSKMINDLSTLSRAERGLGDQKELIDLKEMTENLFNEYSKKAESHGLTLNIDPPKQRIYTFTSRLYLEEVLQNLLTNAIKYTPKGSVTLSIQHISTTNQARIAVIDTGIGISKSDQKKVFGKFYRSEDYRTRETSGTGLGLYVVSKLARKLKIKVQLESSINKGSTFYFLIPLASKDQIDRYRNVK